MASNKISAATILVLLSLIAYSTFTVATSCPPPEAEPTPPPKPKLTPPPKPSPCPPTPPAPVAKPTPPPKPKPTPPPVAKPTPPVEPKPTPPPKPSPCPPTPPAPAPAPVQEKCPKDALKLGVCADLLGLVNVIGNPPSGTPCCTFIKGLADLEAAVCLCTAIKGNVLGLNLNVPVTLNLILSACQKTVPPGFKCA